MWLKEVKNSTRACNCKQYFPSSNNGITFSPGSIWRCDNCSRAWVYDGITVVDSSLNTTKDNWSRSVINDE